MIKLVIGLVLLVGLSGCVLSGALLPKTHLEIKFLSGQGGEPYYIIKNTNQLRWTCGKKGAYITWTGRCNFGTNPPETLTFQATPWINRQEFNQLLHQDIDLLQHNYAHSLPPSAWRTYTVNLKPIQDEVNRLYRTDPRGTYKFGAKATVTLYIDGNGNISQEVDYDRVTKGWLL